jgi:hypothetical protein
VRRDRAYVAHRMNYQRRLNPVQIEQAAEQRQREHAAPRLHRELPALVSLRLTLDDLRPHDGIGSVSYAKPIVVATAPSHFEIRCAEPRCDGRHDLTAPIVSALRAGLPSSSGRSACSGWVGEMSCDRTLTYGYQATYRS